MSSDTIPDCFPATVAVVISLHGNKTKTKTKTINQALSVAVRGVTLECLDVRCSARRRSKQSQAGGREDGKSSPTWRKPLSILGCVQAGWCMPNSACPCSSVVSHLLGKMSDGMMDDIIDRSSRELTHERRETSCLCLETRCNSFWITHQKNVPG